MSREAAHALNAPVHTCASSSPLRPPSLPKSPPRAQRTTALGRRYSPAAPMNNGCSPAAPMDNGVTHAVARARRPGATALATPVLTRPLSRPFPPPNDSVSRAAVRPQPLAVTQGEPIREDEEHQEEPWEGRHDGTKIDVRRAHFTLTCDIDNPHSPKYYGSNASSDPTATTNQPHQLRF